MPANAPIFGKFDQDPRVHFDKTAGTWQYEDEESGTEYEWNGKVWIPVLDEEVWKAQQAAYSIQGVDENVPAAPVIAREERRNKKRKKEVDYTTNSSDRAAPVASSSKPTPTPSAPKKTAVWVTALPPNTTPQLMASVFSKAGVLLIGDDGEPRIKMYYDDNGRFKGEALVMYFKEGSVDLAITLLDDTELEMGAGFGNMRVRVAEYDKSQAQGKEEGKKEKKAEVKTEGAGNGESGEGTGKEKKKLAFEEKAKMSKRLKTMQNKLTWHSDSDSDDPAAPAEGAPLPGSSRFNRVVVLKGMFTLEDLEKDASLLLELKEDVREEAETLGQVTSVILYDKEEDGVMTVKFKDPVSAQACVYKMHGRFFDGRKIQATIFNGRERFQKSGARDVEEEDSGERERLDNFAQWLVDGEEDQ